MKKMIFLLAILCISNCYIQAQEATQASEPLSIGPYIALKAGVNGSNVQEGRKNGMSFNGIPDAGIGFFMPLGNNGNLGLFGDLGYSLYTFDIKDIGKGTVYNNKYAYVTFSPNFQFGYFRIGFNLGIPISGKVEEDVKNTAMNYLAEFRLTGWYPLIEDADGKLILFLTGGYMMTGIFKDYAKDDPLKKYIPVIPPDYTTNKFNLRAISASIGINYMFNIAQSASVVE